MLVKLTHGQSLNHAEINNEVLAPLCYVELMC
jgi:hypothetical protein